MENVPEKEIDNLLKKSFTLTNEEKEKYSKEILTDEEIKKLKAMMTNSEDNFCKSRRWFCMKCMTVKEIDDLLEQMGKNIDIDDDNKNIKTNKELDKSLNECLKEEK